MSTAFKVLILDDWNKQAVHFADWASLPPNVEVSASHDHLDDEALVKKATGMDALVVMRERTKIHAGLFEALPGLKLVVTSGPKNSAIDLTAAEKHGVVVCGTKSLKAPPAELTIGLMLGLARKLGVEYRHFREGGPWAPTLGMSLEGKTIGILGLGAIGSRVAKVCQALGMDVVAWSQNLTAEKAAEQGVRLAPSKEALLKKSDVVSVHLRLSDRTRDLISATEFGLMKETALLVNTSRAEIVNQAAMLDALKAGRIGGAAADVYETEPLPDSSELRGLDNFLGSPHIGYVTDTNYEQYFVGAVDGIAAFLAGAPIRELYPSDMTLKREADSAEAPKSKL